MIQLKWIIVVVVQKNKFKKFLSSSKVPTLVGHFYKKLFEKRVKEYKLGT
jgi:hypothetical protein